MTLRESLPLKNTNANSTKSLWRKMTWTRSSLRLEWKSWMSHWSYLI